MKKLALIVLVLSLSISSYAFNTPTESPKNDKLHAEISKILHTITLEFDADVLTANVTFTVTTKGEIVVLAVDTDNQELESRVKSKLNYKKVSVKSERNGIIYIVPLKLVK